LNSTHFPPQSTGSYLWYHDIAMQRATACNALYQNLFLDKSVWNDQSIAASEYVQECEREAIAIEAVGQHYLQDNWAMGHMWQRWGGPTLDDFLPGYPYAPCLTCATVSEDERQRAVVIALVTGLIHGADAVVRGYSDPTAGFNLDLIRAAVPPQAVNDLNALFGTDTYAFSYGDQMSFGRDPAVAWVSKAFATATGTPILYSGVGDLYSDGLSYNDFLNPSGFGDPATAQQALQLITCSAEGLRQVYAATAQQSGRLTGRLYTVMSNPTGPECQSQRATNLAMYVGMGLNVTTGNSTDPLMLRTNRPIPFEVLFGAIGRLVATYYPLPSSTTVPGVQVDANLLAEGILEAIRIGLIGKNRALHASGATDVSDGDAMGPLMGISRNDQFPSPASDLDPHLPPLDPTSDTQLLTPADHASAIARVFHRGHVADWCNSPDAAPQALQASAKANANTPFAQATFDGCLEFAVRNVRLVDAQTGHAGSSICDAAVGGGTPGQYGFSDTSGAADRVTAATNYCKSCVYDVSNSWTATQTPPPGGQQLMFSIAQTGTTFSGSASANTPTLGLIAGPVVNGTVQGQTISFMVDWQVPLGCPGTYTGRFDSSGIINGTTNGCNATDTWVSNISFKCK
jgi:hypothetical protein